MTKDMLVHIVSPSQPIVETKASGVSVPCVQGYIQILPGHAALVSEIDIGEIVVHRSQAKGELRYFVSGGYVEVDSERVTILADVVEDVLKIDRERAEAARQRADERLISVDASVDVKRALSAHRRAEARLLASIKSTRI